uniref:uncharacterized protein LOC120339714 isoform X1 n=1 Tax=Styela clava TaxID=7725 RepID=UPI0019399E92|nr:uncharacterized protein LOC120339714 isoform X1 [Styela clava]
MPITRRNHSYKCLPRVQIRLQVLGYCRLWEVVDLVKYSAGSAEGKSVSTSNRCAGERQGILRFAQRKARYKKIGFGRRACVVFMHRGKRNKIIVERCGQVIILKLVHNFGNL